MVEAEPITPPVGLNVFITNAIARDVPMRQTFSGVVAFFGSEILRIILLVVLPATAFQARLKRTGVDYIFANSDTDFPAIIEGMAYAAAKDINMPQAIVIPMKAGRWLRRIAALWRRAVHKR